MKLQQWKATLRRNVRRLSPADATLALAAIREEERESGPTIFHSTIRALTGGFNSQTINFVVIRALAVRSKAAR
jgi:hypothetical protein